MNFLSASDTYIRAKVLRFVKEHSKSNIYLHAKEPMHTVQNDRRLENKGRPRLLTEREKRNLIQGIHALRRSVGSFSICRLKLEAKIDKQISDYTVRRLLNRERYKYKQSRKKGLVSQNDLKLRLQFARKVKRLFQDTVWTDGISFYLDGTSFSHKKNPCDQARSTKSMTWKKRKERLSLNRTARAAKVGCRGKMAHFIVAIAYNRRVVLCEQYHEPFTWVMHCKLYKDSLWRYIFKYAESKPQTISTVCWSTPELQKSKESHGEDWGTVICNITKQFQRQPHWKSLSSCSKKIECAGFIRKYHSKKFHAIYHSGKERSRKLPVPHYQEDYWIYEHKNVNDNQVQRPEDQTLKRQRLLSHTEFKGHLAGLEKVSAEWNSRLWSKWRGVARPKLTC